VTAPTILTNPQSATASAGASAALWVEASGTSPLVYQWSFNGSPLPGANGSLLFIADMEAPEAGSYTVTVSNSAGSAPSAAAVLSLASAGTGTPASFTEQPASQTISGGSTVVFHASTGTAAAGATPSPVHAASPNSTGLAVRAVSTGVTYQWFLNGVAIPGATDSTYVVHNATAADDGTYTCLATSAAGTVESAPATLLVSNAPANPGRLINLSCRAQVATGADQLIAGFVLGGGGTSGTDPVLVRASGPALAPFGVPGILPDPSIVLGTTAGAIASDSAWGGDTRIAAAAASVGAFPWSSTSSHDSALLESLAAGSYTAQVSGTSGDSGIALAEVYDALPAGSPAGSPRLINLSARVRVGTGGNILIAGFVIGGTTSKTVLVRASGPALGQFGVPGLLADPQLQIFRNNADGTSTLLTQNSGWGGDAQIASVAAAAGAFSWGAAATPDSAELITLPPGAYTAQVSGASGDTGVALVEVYDIP
jgi:hypothetical protein